MGKWKKIAHVVYQCSYHIVWCPKYRFRILTGQVRDWLDHRIRALAEYKGVEILEMSICEDHVHMVVTIPPKLSVSDWMGLLKGKTAIGLFQKYPVLKKKPYWGNHFWSRGYCVTTVGLDEEKIRRYVKYQEDAERREEEQQAEFGLF
jgi:putative transposase